MFNKTLLQRRILPIVVILLLTIFFIKFASGEENRPSNISAEEFECLVENIYHEAGGESVRGKIAVGVVTMNRTKDERYPKTICGVVKQGPINKWHWEQRQAIVPIKHRCQFSWWCDGKKERIDYGSLKYYDSIVAARKVLTGNYDDLVGGATHYHAEYVNPEWASRLIRIVQIDSHIFYKYKNI
jgi:spore germination cell wall hydrolase CwlJ-like protein